MRRNKSDYIAIVLGVILLLVVFSIAYIASINSVSQIPDEPLPTDVPEKLTPFDPSSQVKYDEAAEEKLIDTIRKRPPLSDIDAAAKDTMLETTLKGYNSGVAYESESVRIEYIKSLDLFMAEVKTIDIARAKADANVWLRSQGLSQRGICDLPVMFMPDADTAQYLRNKNILFSPLPNSC